MSDTALVALLCATVLAGIAMISGTLVYLSVREDRRHPSPPLLRDPRPEEAERMRERIEQAVKPTPGIPWEEAEVKPEPEHPAVPPLPVDPKNPPRTINFPGDPNPPRCVCHGLPVEKGQQVVAWPDGPGYRFFCAKEGS